MNDILTGSLIFLVGAIASFINVLAGGGSILTVGTMILLGLDPSIANGTNRVGVFFGTVSSVAAYKSERMTELKESLILGALTIPGAILGALYATKISDLLFQRILAIISIAVIITLLVPQKKKINENGSKGIRRFLIYPSMFLIGFYGGFIQIGVGFILMAAIRHLMQISLVRVNMHKVFVVFIYSFPILFVFALTGNINWFYAIMLSLGNLVGGWISVKMSIKKGDGLVKYVLAFSMFLIAIKLLFTF